MKWIQANIHKFGGDAKQVTVSGHSAGSASAHLHTISPLSKGLLSQAISLSGTAANFWAGRATSHAKYAKQMGQLFECPIDTNQGLIQCLRQVDPRELTQAQWKLHDFFHASPAKLPLSTFLPRIGKSFKVLHFALKFNICLTLSFRFQFTPSIIFIKSS